MPAILNHIRCIAQNNDCYEEKPVLRNLIFLSSLAALFLSCNGLTLDKDSNCRNILAPCHKPDKTAPSFVSTVYPTPGTAISTLSEIQLMFSEELKDPQPSDFSFSESGMSIISVSQVDKYTYKLLTNKNP